MHANANIVAIIIDLAMTASGRESGADAENPRSRHLSLGDGGPQCENNLGITGADVAHGSETGGQRDCRVVSRIESDLGIGIFDRTQPVSSVELRCRVHVAIDRPGRTNFLRRSISSPPGRGSMKPPDTALIRSPSIRTLCSNLDSMSGSASKSQRE